MISCLSLQSTVERKAEPFWTLGWDVTFNHYTWLYWWTTFLVCELFILADAISLNFTLFMVYSRLQLYFISWRILESLGLPYSLPNLFPNVHLSLVPFMHRICLPCHASHRLIRPIVARPWFFWSDFPFLQLSSLPWLSLLTWAVLDNVDRTHILLLLVSCRWAARSQAALGIFSVSACVWFGGVGYRGFRIGQIDKLVKRKSARDR